MGLALATRTVWVRIVTQAINNAARPTEENMQG